MNIQILYRLVFFFTTVLIWWWHISNDITIISGITFNIIFFVHPWCWFRWEQHWFWLARQTRHSSGLTFCCWCFENKRPSCCCDIPDITSSCKIFLVLYYEFWYWCVKFSWRCYLDLALLYPKCWKLNIFSVLFVGRLS